MAVTKSVILINKSSINGLITPIKSPKSETQPVFWTLFHFCQLTCFLSVCRGTAEDHWVAASPAVRPEQRELLPVLWHSHGHPRAVTLSGRCWASAKGTASGGLSRSQLSNWGSSSTLNFSLVTAFSAAACPSCTTC